MRDAGIRFSNRAHLLALLLIPWTLPAQPAREPRVSAAVSDGVYIDSQGNRWGCPMTRPEVIAVFHSDDFSAVTADKPARIGEYRIASAAGLGPVRPNLELGKPFPPLVPGAEYVVNSPLEVTVGGQAAQVLNALGLTVAWIAGPEVEIPVR